MDRVTLFIITLVVGAVCLAWLWRPRRNLTPVKSALGETSGRSHTSPHQILSGDAARAWLDNFLVEQQKK